MSVPPCHQSVVCKFSWVPTSEVSTIYEHGHTVLRWKLSVITFLNNLDKHWVHFGVWKMTCTVKCLVIKMSKLWHHLTYQIQKQIHSLFVTPQVLQYCPYTLNVTLFKTLLRNLEPSELVSNHAIHTNRHCDIAVKLKSCSGVTKDDDIGKMLYRQIHFTGFSFEIHLWCSVQQQPYLISMWTDWPKL